MSTPSPKPLRDAADYQVRREPTEIVRERFRPDWLSIALGTVSTLAFMGVFALVGEGFRLLRITPNESVGLIVVKLLWLICGVSLSTYIGGFVAGATMPVKSRIAAALDGLIVTQLTILTVFISTWTGFTTLPGIGLVHGNAGASSEALLWWAMMLALPNLFAAVFGAMHGNDLVDRRAALGPNILLPLERTEVGGAEAASQPSLEPTRETDHDTGAPAKKPPRAA